jgi:DNA polymerase-3 subunit delta'
MLLCGPPRIGKRRLSDRVVQALLCREPGDELRGCGECQSCRLFISGAHPDYRYVSFETRKNSDRLRTEITVDQIRDLISTLVLTATFAPRKVAVIEPAEAMNRSAENALLKTLEEPAGDTVLILLSHRPSGLAATIRSRCQRFPVVLPERGRATRWIMDEAGVEEAPASAALTAASGSPAGALDLIRAGLGERYLTLTRGLRRLRAEPAFAAELAGEFEDFDPELTWSWLSILAAAEVSRRMADGKTRGQWLRGLSALQREADRNRRLLATSLRKDLLVHGWLIQYAQLAGRAGGQMPDR